jgi:hypothetical protein
MITDNRTTANVAPTTSSSTIAGNLLVRADHSEHATHIANANANTAELGAGAGIAIGVMEGHSEAFLGNTMTVGGTTTVLANTETFMDADAIASSLGIDGGPAMEFQLDIVMDELFKALLPAVQFNSSTNVISGNDTFVVTGHGLSTGDKVVYVADDGDPDTPPGTPVGGLTSGTAYFVRFIDADTFSLHTTAESAEDPLSSPINVAPGSGAGWVVRTAPLVWRQPSPSTWISTTRWQGSLRMPV